MLDHHVFVFGLVAASSSLVTAIPTSSDGVEGSMTTYAQTIIPTTPVTGSMTTMLTSSAPTAAPSAKAAYRDRLGDLLRDWLDQLEEAVGVNDHLQDKKRAVVEVRQTADPMPTFTPDPPTHTADPMPTFTPDPPTHTADPMPTFTPDPPALVPDPMPTIHPDPTKPPRYAATPSPVLFGLPEWWPLFVSNATQSVASRTSASPSAGFPTNTLPPSTGMGKKTAAPLVGAIVAAAGAYYLL
ncbi:hypothetical protein MKX07_001694 [Trichoderma sp. CBMAI-0711]|uniref:Uncharacterized protein n=1 Tax=Trichoderma parareesei TaxID=858221 RepID=A0A2H2Z8H0_TRIPA|nr:hypothetical protein MKX07_001694 [Trichoderma sp. CBMAI-0711]OTA03659.1 hypothetical protein A9Z42_0041180 [Trichoderma parareesei]